METVRVACAPGARSHRPGRCRRGGPHGEWLRFGRRCRQWVGRIGGQLDRRDPRAEGRLRLRADGAGPRVLPPAGRVGEDPAVQRQHADDPGRDIRRRRLGRDRTGQRLSRGAEGRAAADHRRDDRRPDRGHLQQGVHQDSRPVAGQVARRVRAQLVPRDHHQGDDGHEGGQARPEDRAFGERHTTRPGHSSRVGSTPPRAAPSSPRRSARTRSSTSWPSRRTSSRSTRG